MADKKEKGQNVVDVGKWEWSELFEREDWWAVWRPFRKKPINGQTINSMNPPRLPL